MYQSKGFILNELNQSYESTHLSNSLNKLKFDDEFIRQFDDHLYLDNMISISYGRIHNFPPYKAYNSIGPI